MAAKKVKITYQDEREPQIVKVLPRAQVMTEEYLKGFTTANVLTGTFYLAWAALNSLRKTDLDYETWLNQVEDVEDVEDVEEPVDPTPGDQSADTSSSSASEADSPTAT